MNPRSVTTVIDFFAWRRGPAEMSRDLAQSGVYFLELIALHLCFFFLYWNPVFGLF